MLMGRSGTLTNELDSKSSKYSIYLDPFQDSLLNWEAKTFSPYQIRKEEKSHSEEAGLSQEERKLQLIRSTRVEESPLTPKPSQLSSRFSFTQKRVHLQSLSWKRKCCSLSGLPSHLVAIAGYNYELLNTCEHFYVAVNKWADLPSFNFTWTWPGSVRLKSMTAFCFCGYSGLFYHHSI